MQATSVAGVLQACYQFVEKLLKNDTGVNIVLQVCYEFVKKILKTCYKCYKCTTGVLHVCY